MIITRDNAVWHVNDDGSQTQATPRQCAAEIERLRAFDEVLIAERERCAKIADAYVISCGSVNGREAGDTIAKTIRSAQTARERTMV